MTRTPASVVVTVLFVLAGAALLWNAWAPAWSWLTVAVGLVLAAVWVSVLLHRYEERQTRGRAVRS